jgi:hypothetical protein
MRWFFVALIVAGQLCGAALAQTNPAPPAAAMAMPPKYPAEAFGALPLMSEPQLSPSGTYLAAKISINGKTALGTMKIGDITTLRRMPETAETEIQWFKWVTDDHIVVSLSAVEKIEFTPVVVTRLISTNRNLSEFKKLNWHNGAISGDDVIHWPRNGGTEIIMQARDTIYSNYPGYDPVVEAVDVITGKKRRELPARSGIDYWYTDSTGTVRLGYGYDYELNRAIYVYRTGKGEPFRTLD